MSWNSASLFGSYATRAVSNSLPLGDIGSLAFLSAGSSVGRAHGATSLPNAGSLQRIAPMTATIVEYGIAPSDRLNAMCTFDNAPKQNVSCWLGSEYVKGDASAPAGIASPSGKLRVFAGLRDDPAFFNRGAFLAQRTYINTAVNTQPFDVSGCQINTGANGFAAAPADAFLGKNVLAIVLSVDKTLLVDAASPVLSVSASTRSSP